MAALSENPLLGLALDHSSPLEFGHYYDKLGLPISMMEWGERRQDRSYAVVAQDNLGPVWISTVWVGMDLAFRLHGPPIIFETMIFADGHVATDDDDELDTYQWRYATEEEAKQGHAEALQYVKDRILPPEAVDAIRKLLDESHTP